MTGHAATTSPQVPQDRRTTDLAPVGHQGRHVAVLVEIAMRRRIHAASLSQHRGLRRIIDARVVIDLRRQFAIADAG